MTRLHFALPAVLLTMAPPLAPAQTWSGAAGDGNWNNPNNWVPQTFPNSPYNVAIFNATGAGTVNIASSVQAYSLNFTNVGFNSYTLTSSPGQTLSGLTAINLPNPIGNDDGTQTINLAYQAGGNLFFASDGPLTITNNTQIISSAPGLLIGPNTVIGTLGQGGVVVTGYSVTTLSGSFATGANEVVGGLTKTGYGQLIFSGDGTNLYGGLTLNGGSLTLDYTTNAASKLGSGNLTLSGGNLNLIANATTVSQTVSGTNLAGGHAEVFAQASANGTIVSLYLAAITRSPGATVDFSYYGASFSPRTNTGNTNGLLGAGPAYATFGNGATWATNSGGTIIGLPDSSYGVDTYSAGTNTDFGGGFVHVGNVMTNSIRFNNSNTTNVLNLNIVTLQSGGILMTPNSGPITIYGDGLTTPGGSGELLVHQYNTTNPLTIQCSILTAGGLTKTGPGTLILAPAATPTA